MAVLLRICSSVVSTMAPVAATLCLLAIAVFTVSEGYKNYANYEVLRIHPNTEEAIDVINSLKEHISSDEIQFWTNTNRVGVNVDVLVSPHVKLDFESVLTTNHISYKTLVGDLKSAIDNDMKSINRPRYRANLRKGGSQSFDLYSYKSHAEMNEYLDILAKENPSFVTTFSIGNSFEGRSMKVIKPLLLWISKPYKENKSGLWLDAGIHAREWIAPSSALYLISKLTNGSDWSVQQLLEAYDIYIIPCLNPDGYEYSRKEDRLWRTTRSLQQCNRTEDPNRGKCKCGADMNRNFDFHFGELGVSKEPCRLTYPGPKAFSEAETVNMAKWFQSHMNTIHLYISLHSYGNYIFYPYTYEVNKYHSNDSEPIAQQTAKVIKEATGVSYKIGTAPDILYPASGTSLDWVAAMAKVPYAFVFELTNSSFILDERYIQPAGEEFFVAFKKMANLVLQKLQPI